MVFVYLLMALFGAAAVAFAAQNPDPVQLTFLAWKSPSMPLSFVLLMSTFVGVVVASVSAFAEKIHLQRRVRALERQVSSLAAETWPPPPLRAPMRERVIPPPPSPPSPPSPPPPPVSTSAPTAAASGSRTTVPRAEIRPPLTRTEVRPPL